MSGLLESIKELIKNEYGAVSDKEFTGLLSPGGRKLGFKSDKEQVLKDFKNTSQYVPDESLSGWLTQQMPYLKRIGVGNFDRNLPPHELRKLIEAITTGRFGGVSDKETTYGIEVDGEEKDYTFTGDKEFDSSTMDKFRETHGIQADSVDEQFGRVLSAMPVWQQESVINFITSQGMTPAQITKFKQEVLLGNISPYELENLQTNQSTQSNLGLSNDQYAQGSQFYNYDLGVFLPSEWQTGFTGRTVDGNNYFREELQSNPHSKSRNYYEEKMKLPRYIPLKFG